MAETTDKDSKRSSAWNCSLPISVVLFRGWCFTEPGTMQNVRSQVAEYKVNFGSVCHKCLFYVCVRISLCMYIYIYRLLLLLCTYTSIFSKHFHLIYIKLHFAQPPQPRHIFTKTKKSPNPYHSCSSKYHSWRYVCGIHTPWAYLGANHGRVYYLDLSSSRSMASWWAASFRRSVRISTSDWGFQSE